MTTRILVGYTATSAGADAAALGARLAAATGAVLELVLVLPADERTVITPANPGYGQLLRDRARDWLAEGAAALPDGVVHHEHVRYGDSFAAGLEAAAAEMNATMIVVGAGDGAARGRHQLGSTATDLLHSSVVPVVLAPRGERKNADAGIPRITVAIGTRPGAKALLTTAVDLARAIGAPVRLLSLVAADLPDGVDTGVIRLVGSAHADEVLAQTRAALPETVAADVVTAGGESIADAAAALEWLPGELVLVGSSRLARKHRLFFGSTAAKLLRAVPVPMIVVPRSLKRSIPRVGDASDSTKDHR